MVHVISDKQGTMLFNIDIHHLNGPSVAEIHTHHNLEISTVVEGTGTYVIGDRRYDLRPGDVIILNNIEPHGLILESGVNMRHMVVHFDPAFIWNALSGDLDYNFLLIFFERSANFSHRLDRDNPATAEIVRLMWEIWEEMENREPCCELMAKIKLQTVFATIIRHYDYVDTTRPDTPLPAEYIPGLGEVRRYIDANLSQEIRLADLAAILHVSPAYFSLLFKRFNLVSPVEYIIHKRVQRAIERIRTTTLSMTEIAQECGFNNGTNFYKAFRKVTGRAPSSYRRARGREDEGTPEE